MWWKVRWVRRFLGGGGVGGLDTTEEEFGGRREAEDIRESVRGVGCGGGGGLALGVEGSRCGTHEESAMHMKFFFMEISNVDNF